MLKFNEVLTLVKESDLLVIVEGDNYFTVENKEGFRAYCQLDFYGPKQNIDNLFYYKGYMFSSVHKPNKKTGTGYQEYNEVKIETKEDVFKYLNKTLERSKERILSGREKMDTRKAHENKKYLV